jgi:hypothetical protein
MLKLSSELFIPTILVSFAYILSSLSQGEGIQCANPTWSDLVVGREENVALRWRVALHYRLRETQTMGAVRRVRLEMRRPAHTVVERLGLVVHVRGGRIAGIAHPADHIAAKDVLAGLQDCPRSRLILFHRDAICCLGTRSAPCQGY